MSNIVGSGVIGSELITSFRKKKIVLDTDKWESGNIDMGNGSPVGDNSRVRTKTFFKVESNTQYSAEASTSDRWIALRYYKADGTFISSGSIMAGQWTRFTTPNECKKMKLAYVVTMDYNPKIIIKKV